MKSGNLLPDLNIILASGSPRRQELMRNLGVRFSILETQVEEKYPASLRRENIAVYLSELKAKSVNMDSCPANTVVITADTIVWLHGEILSKPSGREDAVRILSKLSGNTHEVITAVTLKTFRGLSTFWVCSEVCFWELAPEEIEYYIGHYHPYDKAGAYGIQEWIGLVGIKSISGSFLNVVGLPVSELWVRLQRLSGEFASGRNSL